MDEIHRGGNRYLRYLLSLFFVLIFCCLTPSVTAEDTTSEVEDLAQVLFAGVFLRGASAESAVNFPYLSEVLLDEDTDNSGNRIFGVKKDIVRIVSNSIREKRGDIEGFQLIFRGEEKGAVNLGLGLLFNNEYVLTEKYADGSVLAHLYISAMFTLINYRSEAIIASFPFVFSHDFIVKDEAEIKEYLQEEFMAVLGITEDKNTRVIGARHHGEALHSLITEDKQEKLGVDASLLGMIEDGILAKLYLPKEYEDEPTGIRVAEVAVDEKVLTHLGVDGDKQQEDRLKSFLGEVLGSQLSAQYGLSVLPFALHEQGLNALYRQILSGLDYESVKDGETGVFKEVLPVYLVTYRLRSIKEKVMTETAYQRGYGFAVFSTVKLYEAVGEGDVAEEIGNTDLFELETIDGLAVYERIWGSKVKYVTSAVVPKIGYAGFDTVGARRRVVDSSLAGVIEKFRKYKVSKEVIEICTEGE